MTLAFLHTYRYQTCPFLGSAEAGEVGGRGEGLWSKSMMGIDAILLSYIGSQVTLSFKKKSMIL